MSSDVVKYAFIAGEISPTLFGRSDLTKYDLGMAEAYNFFVDYRGGLSSRPGFQFCDFVKADDKDTRMTDFAFSPDIENTYALLLGDEYIRFIQDGAYVLEDAIAFTGFVAGVFSSVAHGLTAGRWVKYSNRTYIVSAATANTFTLTTAPAGAAVTTSGGAGSVYPIYEIESPYAAEDLAGLSFDQYRDYIRITSLDFPPHDLVRADHTDWTIDEAEISPYYEGPTPSGHTASEAGDAETIFAVTSVYEDGTESSIGTPYKADSIVNYPITEGSISITWPTDPEAVLYKVYRSIVSVSEVLSYGTELGYAGRTRGTKFTDPNIIPDFAQTPPVNYHPFAPGAITEIAVTDGGSGYSASSGIVIGGGGTGFDGQVVVDDSGAIVNVIIKNGGTGHVNPTISFTGGMDAEATVTARAMTGTYPSLSAIYQQRQIYAASEDRPITIWGSQYRRFGNFSASDFVVDSDAFEFDLDTAAIAPIKHLLVTRGGMLAMTQENVWLLNGGSGNQPLTPTSALAESQTFTGVSSLKPITIDADILYTEGKGHAVRILSYNEISKIYAGEDKSILSNHLFGTGREIVRWGYQESPFKTVWSVRSDGALLAFTIVKSEDVFAWTPCGTRGKFVDLVVIREVTEDRVYVTTQRYINGRWTKFIERMDLRQFVNVEDAWCVDAGLSLGGTTPAADVTIYADRSGDEVVWTATATASVFTGSANKILRAGDGIFRVSSVTSGTSVVLEAYQAPTNWIPETDEEMTFPVVSGDWTLDATVTAISGLWHLEGETVAILGDGNVFPRQVVTNGAITLPNAVSRCIIGLPFTCKATTLPMIVPDAGIESKRKRVVAVAVRLTRSRGLRYGDSYDRTYDMKERSTEAWGRPTALQEGIRYQHIGTKWDENGQTYFKLEDPLPATLLSLVSDIEVGDEPD